MNTWTEQNEINLAGILDLPDSERSKAILYEIERERFRGKQGDAVEWEVHSVSAAGWTTLHRAGNYWELLPGMVPPPPYLQLNPKQRGFVGDFFPRYGGQEKRNHRIEPYPGTLRDLGQMLSRILDRDIQNDEAETGVFKGLLDAMTECHKHAIETDQALPLSEFASFPWHGGFWEPDDRRGIPMLPNFEGETTFLARINTQTSRKEVKDSLSRIIDAIPDHLFTVDTHETGRKINDDEARSILASLIMIRMSPKPWRDRLLMVERAGLASWDGRPFENCFEREQERTRIEQEIDFGCDSQGRRFTDSELQERMNWISETEDLRKRSAQIVERFRDDYLHKFKVKWQI